MQNNFSHTQNEEAQNLQLQQLDNNRKELENHNLKLDNERKELENHNLKLYIKHKNPGWFAQFFQEDNGSYSAMRLMCFLALGTAMFLSWLKFDHVQKEQSAKLEYQKSLVNLLTDIKNNQNLALRLVEKLPPTSTIPETSQTSNSDSEEFLIVLSFIGAAFAGKVGQKFAENQENEPPNSSAP